MISTILNQFFCLQEKIHWNKSLGIIIVLPVGLEVTSLPIEVESICSYQKRRWMVYTLSTWFSILIWLISLVFHFAVKNVSQIYILYLPMHEFTLLWYLWNCLATSLTENIVFFISYHKQKSHIVGYIWTVSHLFAIALFLYSKGLFVL